MISSSAYAKTMMLSDVTMMSSGKAKNMIARYTNANHRYLAVVLPSILHRPIGNLK